MSHILSGRCLHSAPFIFIALVVPHGAVLGGAVFKTWGVDYSLTLDHFEYVFASRVGIR